MEGTPHDHGAAIYLLLYRCPTRFCNYRSLRVECNTPRRLDEHTNRRQSRLDNPREAILAGTTTAVDLNLFVWPLAEHVYYYGLQ